MRPLVCLLTVDIILEKHGDGKGEALVRSAKMR
jgi:hypothetical protein